MNELLWTVAKTFLITLILTPIVRDVFRAYNIVDRPGRRKVHAYPIPRVGGIPVFIAYAVALITFAEARGHDALVWKLMPGVATIFLTGLLDDFFDLKPVVKLVGQILAAVLVFANGLGVTSIAGTDLHPWASLVMTIFWLLLSTNALNLIDGLDGLCGGMGLLASLTLMLAGLLQGEHALVYVTLPMIGALLGFLCYNFNPATVFLGDSGALTIGFVLGCFGMLWTQKTATLLSVMVPLIAISVPLLDVSLAVVRRSLKNKPIFGADRGHIHHRLLDQGLTPRKAVLILYLAAMVAALFALILSSSLRPFQGLAVLAMLVVVFAGIRQLRYPEFVVFKRLIFQGEFQRALEMKTKVEYLAAALSRCSTADAWWSALVAAGREHQWTGVRWTSGAGVRREHRYATNSGPEWEFSIPIGAEEAIHLNGRMESEQGTDFIALAAVLNKTRSKLCL